MKRAGIYSPYWDTLGGGEKYVATIVSLLDRLGYEVDIWWSQENVIRAALDRYDYDLSGVNVLHEGFEVINQGSVFDKVKFSQTYDFIFFVSDGSVPWLFSKRNILHFQVPFHNVSGRSLNNRLKLRNFSSVVCNSKFTKTVVDGEFGIDSQVIYPPAEQVSPGEKENLILSVGRFDNLLHSKRQDILIKVFEKLNLPDWKLVLAGGVLHGEKQVEHLKNQIRSKNIEIMVNPDHKELVNLYAKARIYWHAAGFGHDLSKYPEKAEHFGMATVEAMSAGAVPIVFAGGGQIEIISDNINGILWTNEKELAETTISLIEDHELLTRMSSQAQNRSKLFSRKEFERGFKQIIG